MMRRLLSIIVALFGTVFLGPAPANSAEPKTAAEAVQEADRSFSAGDFSAAVEMYQRAQALGASNGFIEYNLGNTFARLRQPGRAILHLRRAELLLGSDPEVEANLRFLRGQLKDPPAPNCPGSSKLLGQFGAAAASSAGGRLWLALGSWVVLWTAIGVGAFVESRMLRWFGGMAAIVALITGISYWRIAPGSAGQSCFFLSESPKKFGSVVVVKPQLEVLSGDTPSAQVVSVLNEGAEISSGEERNGYLQLFLPDGRSGFVPKDSIEPV